MINVMQYELAHERIAEARRSAEHRSEVHRLAAAQRWQRIERAVAAAHVRVSRSAQTAVQLSRVNG